MLHHQDTKNTKGHPGKAGSKMPFLVKLCALGALVVKFYFIVIKHNALFPSFSLNRRRVFSENTVDVGAGVVKLC